MFEEGEERAAGGGLEIERDAQRPSAILRVAGELESRGGEIVELFKEIRAEGRQVVVPIHLRRDGEDFFFEVETGPWESTVRERVIEAVLTMRAVLGTGANLELVSAYPAPREIRFLFERSPAALFELDLVGAHPGHPEACAELFRETAERHWDAELDYGPEGLRLTEELLRAVLEDDTDDPAPVLDGLVYGLGCYVGEVIRRNSGAQGSWRHAEDWGEALVLEFPELVVDSVGKARAFLERGDEDSVSYYAQYALKELGNASEERP
jgi:hypothetical protein